MRSSFSPRALRAVQLTTAFVVLALPAEAFAFSGSAGSTATASPTPLPVHVAPRHLHLGAPVHVTGRLPASDAGVTVELEAARSPHGRWRRIASTRVGAAGGYELRAAPRYSARLRAVPLAPLPGAATTPTSRSPAGGPAVGGSTGGGAAARVPRARAAGPRRRSPALSRVATVQVKAAMRVARRSRGVIAGHELSIAGHLEPGRAGRTVAVQRRAGRAWHTIALGRTGARGGFAVRFRPAADAHGFLRVVFAGDRANGRATAAAGALSVYQPVVASWYADAGTTACGFHATYGVANRTLPCGTRVRLRHGDRTVTAIVDDRGPYVYGRDYDLNEATAGALGFSGVGTIDASVQ
ncbi:MAG TPA: septal ring lytic transglycosylase RlpA family protein [Solirubrobacteraceae bacterium]|nr:septal ring lytic transglycosylase RlpA family protein [Solirubrobacteraceae bacterium]